MIPPRAWLLPGDDCGTWKAENNGSAEMAGAVEYALVSEVERLREALEFYADLSAEGPWHLPSEDYGKRARSALKGDGDE